MQIAPDGLRLGQRGDHGRELDGFALKAADQLKRSRKLGLKIAHVSHRRISCGLKFAFETYDLSLILDTAALSLGELRLALQQLRLAQKTDDITNYQRLRIDARMDEINEEIAQLEQGTLGRERQRKERRR